MVPDGIGYTWAVVATIGINSRNEEDHLQLPLTLSGKYIYHIVGASLVHWQFYVFQVSTL